MTRYDRIATSRRPGSAPRRRIAGAARHRLVAVAAAAALASSLSVTGTPAAAAQRGLAARAVVAAPRAVAVSTGRARGARPPDRIISLSPTATEMLFAIGAGRQVVAVDEDSDYPPAAPRTKLSGLDPNIEAIARYNPDLVVVPYDPEGFAKSLSALGVPRAPRAGGNEPRRDLRPDRVARQGDRPRENGGDPRAADARRDRHRRRRGAAVRIPADLLLRARTRLLLGHVVDLRRPAAVDVRAPGHRGHRARARRAATRSSRTSTS